MNSPDDILFTCVYGSRLYGTSTPTSDTDLKSVYLPPIDDLLLTKRQVAFKTRVDERGDPVPDGLSMPDNGVENEFIPFQTFVRDFVNGQTYAVEIAYAILKDGPSAPDKLSVFEYNTVVDMINKFGNNEVYSMVGFAMKQTFDYVRRGERLNEVVNVSQIIDAVVNEKVWVDDDTFVLRLDTASRYQGKSLLDVISERSGLPIGEVTNNNRKLRTLEMGGRSYSETTTIAHLLTQLDKLIKQYGVRSTAAADTDVDFKSLSHAVRVYQQAIENLDHGKVTFPRPNAVQLLEIKEGRADLEKVKDLLRELDVEVQVKMVTSTQRKKTPELVEQSEQWLLEVLRVLYCLETSA